MPRNRRSSLLLHHPRRITWPPVSSRWIPPASTLQRRSLCVQGRSPETIRLHLPRTLGTIATGTIAVPGTHQLTPLSHLPRQSQAQPTRDLHSMRRLRHLLYRFLASSPSRLLMPIWSHLSRPIVMMRKWTPNQRWLHPNLAIATTNLRAKSRSLPPLTSFSRLLCKPETRNPLAAPRWTRSFSPLRPNPGLCAQILIACLHLKWGTLNTIATLTLALLSLLLTRTVWMRCDPRVPLSPLTCLRRSDGLRPRSWSTCYSIHLHRSRLLRLMPLPTTLDPLGPVLPMCPPMRLLCEPRLALSWPCRMVHSLPTSCSSSRFLRTADVPITNTRPILTHLCAVRLTSCRLLRCLSIVVRSRTAPRTEVPRRRMAIRTWQQPSTGLVMLPRNKAMRRLHSSCLSTHHLLLGWWTPDRLRMIYAGFWNLIPLDLRSLRALRSSSWLHIFFVRLWSSSPVLTLPSFCWMNGLFLLFFLSVMFFLSLKFSLILLCFSFALCSYGHPRLVSGPSVGLF